MIECRRAIVDTDTTMLRVADKRNEWLVPESVEHLMPQEELFALLEQCSHGGKYRK